MNGTLIDVDGRPALHFVRPLPHSPERVWRAVTEEIDAWFPVSVDWDAVEVIAWTPPREVVWRDIRATADGLLVDSGERRFGTVTVAGVNALDVKRLAPQPTRA